MPTEPSNPVALVYTRYTGGLNGGLIRHEQILNLVKRAGCEPVVNAGISPRFHRQILPSFLAAMGIVLGANFQNKKLLIRARQGKGFMAQLLVGRYYRAATEAIRQRRPRFLVVEDVIFGGQGAIFAGKKLGVPVIAMPHNVDALGGVADRMRSCVCLSAEMEALSLANKTFAISQSDGWLQQQFGIDSSVLSYYPAPERESYLRSIRAARENHSPSQRFLIPGNAHNPPTREGLMELLEAIASRTWPDGVGFDVIGTATESCRKPIFPSQIVIHGAVKSEQFMSLVAKCAACIAYQKKGTGSLTRVPEMLIAGVPVFGNKMALRDWIHTDGVYAFNNFDDLAKLLSGYCKTPQIPEPTIWQEEQFLSAIHRLCINGCKKS